MAMWIGPVQLVPYVYGPWVFAREGETLSAEDKRKNDSKSWWNHYATHRNQGTSHHVARTKADSAMPNGSPSKAPAAPPKKLIMVVTGGRPKTWPTEVARKRVRAAAWRALDACIAGRDPADCYLVHGDAGGWDTWCKEWAVDRGVRPVPEAVTKEEWRAKPKLAGFERNTRMVDRVVTARAGGFDVKGIIGPGGNGTADCARKMRTAKIDVVVVTVDEAA